MSTLIDYFRARTVLDLGPVLGIQHILWRIAL